MRLGWIICAFTGIFLATGAEPARATCTLYEGDDSPAGLNRQEQMHHQAIRQNPNSVQPYCQLAHIYFKRAGAPDTAQRTAQYARCIEYAEAALAHDPQSAPAYFLQGLCLGKRAELKGIWASLEVIQPFEDLMLRAAALDPGLDKGGPHRALGRYYFKLPWFLGGDLTKSIFQLEQALRYGPDHWENLLFLAEAYSEDNQDHRARHTLQHLVKVTGHRAQETDLHAPLKRARALLAEIQTRIGSP